MPSLVHAPIRLTLPAAVCVNGNRVADHGPVGGVPSSGGTHAVATAMHATTIAVARRNVRSLVDPITDPLRRCRAPTRVRRRESGIPASRSVVEVDLGNAATTVVASPEPALTALLHVGPGRLVACDAGL